MPYLQIDTSGLASRVGETTQTTTPESSFGGQRLRTSPRRLRGGMQSFNGNVTTAMSMSPLVATVLGVLGVAVLGFGIVAALPNGGASASEPVDTTSLQTAVETLREENTTLLEENQQLREELRQSQRGQAENVITPIEGELTEAIEAVEGVEAEDITTETIETPEAFLEEAREAGANVLLR